MNAEELDDNPSKVTAMDGKFVYKNIGVVARINVGDVSFVFGKNILYQCELFSCVDR